MSVALARVITALEQSGSRASRGLWQCPAHADNSPSLSVKAVDGRVLIHCHAGCETESIISKLGLVFADLFDGPHPTRQRQQSSAHAEETVFDYVDESGEVLFQVVRLTGKRFRQRRPNPDEPTAYIWNLNGSRRVLYRLPNVIKAVAANETIYLVEGEKDVEAVEQAGGAATCNPGGAGKWRPEYSKFLNGAAVVIVADQDELGERHAAGIAEALCGIAATVRIVKPKHGKDAFDHLAGGYTLDDFAESTNSQARPPTDGARLLDDLVAFVERFVACTTQQSIAIALWILHTHAFGAAETTAYLNISSAIKRSGKSRLLEVCSLLVARPLTTANITSAALFRSIDERIPTLLLDEVDTVFGPKTKGLHEDLRALLNAGYRRGTWVVRCVGEGSRMQTREFQVFCPKALAGIGNVPATIADRSIPIRLKRRSTDEPIERFRWRRIAAEATSLREACETWAAEKLPSLANAEPVLPDELDDRAQDAYEPLIAIADLAGAPWPELARQALVHLRGSNECENDDDKFALRLLSDISTVFAAKNSDRIFSADLADALRRIEEAPWGSPDGTFGPRVLARLLRPFGIKPTTIRIDDKTLAGYKRASFEDAWRRYSGGNGSVAASRLNKVNNPVAALIEDDTTTSTSPPLLRSIGPEVPGERCDVEDVEVKPGADDPGALSATQPNAAAGPDPRTAA